MLRLDILELINQGEGPRLEFKRDDIRAEHLAREIVAFANMNGGCILMGVEDDGSISGIQRPNLQEWLMDAVVGRHVTPYIHLGYQEVSWEGKKIAVMDVPMGTAKPYMLKHNDRQDMYVRYGNVCRLADRTQQARLYESGGYYSAEKFAVPGSMIDELSKRRYLQYFANTLGEQVEVDDMLLKNRYFFVGANGGTSCSYFAYAMFAKKPGMRLPQARVRVTVYAGNDKDYDSLLDRMLDAPYVELRSDENTDEVLEMGIHQRALDAIKPHIHEEKLVDAVRKGIWDYPPEAIREAIVNALIHRDWTKPDYVRLVVYGDRLEVHSPGSLPNGITVDRIKSGARLVRNQECARVFHDYGYMEDQGMGIRRKIIPLCLAHSGREPVFEATEDQFKVTLYKKDACA